MAISVGDAVLKLGVDKTDFDNKMRGLDKNVKTSMQKLQSGLRIGGMAMTAVGAAGLKMVSDSKKMNAALGVTALNLGISTKEMRDLTLATTNVTFPIEEVTKSFDLLSRAGVKDTEVLQSTATAFDTLGDATGMSASRVTDIMVPAMQTFRLTADEMAGKTDELAYMVRNSTVNLDDFNTMVGYTDQEMVDAGFTIDDMAAAMMYMSDQGVAPGRVMLREWQKAVTKSKDEGIEMTEALGMTTDQLEEYRSKLEDSTGTAQEYADVANTQYGIMDKVKQKFSEMTLKASGFLEPMEPLLTGMTALGPIMMVASSSTGAATLATAGHTVALLAHNVAVGAATAAQWLWNTAMSANPIGLITVGIAGLVAGIVLLVKNWDKVKETMKGFYQDYIRPWLNPFVNGINWIIRQLNKIHIKLPKWLGGKSLGIDIPEISLPDFGKDVVSHATGAAEGWARGGIITEPTLLYGLRSQRAYAVAGERGPEAVGPVGASTMNVTYNINGATDIDKLKIVLRQHDKELLSAMNGGRW